MATLKGTHVTDFDSTPFDVVRSRLHGGNTKHYRDAFEIGNTDNGDVTIVFKVGIDEVPTSLKYAHDALTSGALDIGLYKKNADGTYSAVDDNAFADAIDPSSAAALTEALYEAAATNIANANKTMWEWAGLSARPDYAELYVAITHDTGTGADGTFLLQLDTVG